MEIVSNDPTELPPIGVDVEGASPSRRANIKFDGDPMSGIHPPNEAKDDVGFTWLDLRPFVTAKLIRYDGRKSAFRRSSVDNSLFQYSIRAYVASITAEAFASFPNPHFHRPLPPVEWKRQEKSE